MKLYAGGQVLQHLTETVAGNNAGQIKRC